MIESALLIGGLGLGLVLLGRRRRRVRRPLVVVDPPPPPVVEPERNATPGRLERIAEILAAYHSDRPQVGRLVQLRAGQTLEEAVREAFDPICQTTVEQRRHYIHCLSSGNYNARLYGTPSTTKRYGPELLAPGSGIGLRVAALPRNEDAHHAMLMGRMPKMTVDPKTGEPRTSDTSLGYVWFQPVHEDSLCRGELPTCSPYSYADGSSTLEPPPELLSLLENTQ